jgi:hypothetical protein
MPPSSAAGSSVVPGPTIGGTAAPAAAHDRHGWRGGNPSPQRRHGPILLRTKRDVACMRGSRSCGEERERPDDGRWSTAPGRCGLTCRGALVSRGRQADGGYRLGRARGVIALRDVASAREDAAWTTKRVRERRLAAGGCWSARVASVPLMTPPPGPGGVVRGSAG